MILPWYNKDQINFIESNREKLKNYDIFEYGIGNSTIYYSQFAKTITGVETKQNWFESISNSPHIAIKNNVFLNLVSPANFVSFFEKYLNNYKNLNSNTKIFVIIDSIQRAECLKICTDLFILNNIQNSIIMLDNSERDNLKTAIKQTIDKGFYIKQFCSQKVSSFIKNPDLPSKNQPNQLSYNLSSSTMFCLSENFFI
jgi:hypothetical protein